jgi:hypothetical protein
MFHGVFNGGVWILSSQLEYVDIDFQPKAIIGTPYEIESLLVTGLRFSLRVHAVVVDEIHNLNHSGSTERIIHMFPNAKLLGLSATLGNAEHLHAWMVSLNPRRKVNLEVVKERFFNLQQYVFDCETTSLSPVSPLASLSPSSLVESLEHCDIPFTPAETVRLLESIRPHAPEEAAKLAPRQFFAPLMVEGKCNRPSLGHVRQYGKALVKCLASLPLAAQTSVFETFRIPTTSSKVSLQSLVMEIKRSHPDKLPMLAFSLDSQHCRSSFMDLLSFLETADNEANVGRAERLRKAWRQYEKQRRQWESALDRITSAQQRDDYLRDNPPPTSPAAIDALDHKFVIGIPKVGAEEIECLWEHLDLSTGLRDQRKYRSVVRDFIDPLIQGLRRGVGLYTRYMPVFYLRLVQELAQQGKLGLVVSDESLAHGVNMPFRTVAFLGDHEHLTPTLAQQMAGRAGRRGLDRSGNVVFVGFAASRVKDLINGRLVDVVGTEIVTPAVCAMPVTTTTLDRANSLMSIFSNSLNQFSTTRTPEEQALHRTAFQQRAKQARELVDLVPADHRTLLFELRERPEALQICAAVVPELMELGRKWTPNSDGEVIQVFCAIGRFFDPRSGTSWPAPSEPWAVAFLAAIEKRLAACRDRLPPAVPPEDSSLFSAFVSNTAMGLCRSAEAERVGTPQDSEPSSAVGTASNSVAPTPDVEGEEEEEEDLDQQLADATEAMGISRAAIASHGPSLAHVDVAALYAMKDRILDVVRALVTMRNHIAREVHKSKPWLFAKGTPLTASELSEYMARMIFRRFYWIFLETPF